MESGINEVPRPTASPVVAAVPSNGSTTVASGGVESPFEVIDDILVRLGLTQFELQGWRIISRDRFDFFFQVRDYEYLLLCSPVRQEPF